MPLPSMKVTALYLEMTLGSSTSFMVIFSGFLVSTNAKLHDISDFHWGGNSYKSQTDYYLHLSLQVSLVLFTRFFALHFLIPFVIAVVALVHLLFLHQTGFNNPLGLDKNTDKIPFHPYFTVKDILGFAIIITIPTSDVQVTVHRDKFL